MSFYVNAQMSDVDLTALGEITTTGVVVRTGSGTATTRTLTGTSNQITVTNGTGVSGNPTLFTPQDIHTGASPTFAALTLTAALTVANGGTGLASGTSGGVLAFTAAGTLASSGVLTANQLVIGGGAGVAPTPLGSLGTTTTVLHGNASGAPTFAAVTLTTDVTGTLPVANGGTGLTSGTSGGVLAYTATGTLASSGLLTASALVVGGGAGAAPSVLALGTANQVVGMNSGATAHEYKSFAVGTSGTDFAVAHSANTVTFNLPDAGASARGAVTTGTQTFAGAKTFSGAVDFSSTATVAGNLLQGGAAGAATSAVRLLIKKTGIADNTATDVITVTVPNANHAACIKLRILSSNGGTDAFESSRCAEGMVVLARTTGVATVAAVAALDLAQIATVGSGATHTLAYDLSAMTGAVGATQTFTIRLTIDDSGNLGSNQAVILAEVVNAESTGVTIAAA